MPIGSVNDSARGQLVFYVSFFYFICFYIHIIMFKIRQSPLFSSQ